MTSNDNQAIHPSDREHPRDGFNALQFSVAIYTPSSSPGSQSSEHEDEDEHTDPDHDRDHDEDQGEYQSEDDDSLVQPIEVCFHDTFIPTREPISLHFETRDTLVYYQRPPQLPQPTPPCFVIKSSRPIRLVPSSHTAAPPLNTKVRYSYALVLSGIACALAITAVLVCIPTVRYFAHLHLESFRQSICSDLGPVPNSKKLARVSLAPDAVHTTAWVPHIPGILAAAYRWAQIPRRLVSFGHPLEPADDGSFVSRDRSQDAAIVANFSLEAPLEYACNLTKRLTAAVLQSHPNIARTNRALLTAIQYNELGALNAAFGAVQVWDRLRLDTSLEWGWLVHNDVLLLESRLHHLLQTDGTSNTDTNEADTLFFPAPDGSAQDFALHRSRLFQDDDGTLLLDGIPPTIARTIDLLRVSFTRSIADSDVCSFFRECHSPQITAVQFHPVCEILSLLPRPDGRQRALAFLRAWYKAHHLGREESRAPPNERYPNEPALISLMRHLGALGSYIDSLLELLPEDDEKATRAKEHAERSSPWWLRARPKTQTWAGKHPVEDRDGLSREIARLRLEFIHAQEVAAVGAISEAQQTCDQLQEHLEGAHQLLGGRGWLRMSNSGRVVTHGQIQPLEEFMGDLVTFRTQLDAHNLGLSRVLRRIKLAEMRYVKQAKARRPEATVTVYDDGRPPKPGPPTFGYRDAIKESLLAKGDQFALQALDEDDVDEDLNTVEVIDVETMRR
ncbi:hypothetical protein CcaCcLH18_12856 [Colletotrichum camelliae]|nr:hypothetical protein CcaCcLH18_12856 [Colletotrichum camelliae]